MSTSNMNGRAQRKTLASQLDRLDNTIDALADGLNKAVADAVREAVMEAVNTVIAQVLARPELLRLLTGGVNPTPVVTANTEPAKPGMINKAVRWLVTRVSRFWTGLVTTVRNGWVSAQHKACGLPGCLRDGIRGARSRLGVALTRVGHLGRGVWLLRGPALVSLVVGTLVGMIGYLAGPLLSSMALGVCGSAMSFLGILAAPFVQMWRSMRVQETG